ncbi:hypothetical protein GCM10019016_094140 [Streptomyces prasinosporus]|uniref:Uncharacterized protein n=1 Tax=Streptomyces prasinosporus TaxID=68256 RepID=A0ABP6U771_9ACTN
MRITDRRNPYARSRYRKPVEFRVCSGCGFGVVTRFFRKHPARCDDCVTAETRSAMAAVYGAHK